MSIKISELPSATSVGDNDLVPIVQGGETKKALASAFGGGGGGTSDYADLSNKPSINNVTLIGNKTGSDLGLGLETYSTTEQRIGTWINGKPLYEKTFTLTSIPKVTTDGTAVDTKTNIGTNTDFAFIKIAFAISANDSLPNYQTLPYISNSGRQLKTQVTNNSGNLAVDIVSNGTAYNN